MKHKNKVESMIIRPKLKGWAIIGNVSEIAILNEIKSKPLICQSVGIFPNL